jgi:hypothetical protein
MLRADDAPAVLAEFSLGPDGALDGPVARGQVGQVWATSTALTESSEARAW